MLPSVALGHGGALDSSGGHRSGSGYHYHRSSYSPSPDLRSSSFGISYRTAARTTARTTARSYDYQDSIRGEQERREKLLPDRRQEDLEAAARAVEIERRRNEEAEQEMRSQVAAVYHRMAPRYTLHHDTLHPYEAVGLLDNERYWRILLPKGWYVNLEKSRIVRIEPIECPTDFRTWVDLSGTFSIVARLEKINNSYIQFTSINGRRHSIKVENLSVVDRRYLQELLLGIKSTPAKHYKERRMKQVAKVHRFCIIDGRASAEVLKTTDGNEILKDKQWKYPQEITITHRGDVDDLLLIAFPSDIWEEIDEKKFDQLRLSYN